MQSILGFAIFFISLGAVACSYCIATFVQGERFFLPSISETADLPPASCIFTFLMGFSDFFIACAVYVRYKDYSAVLVDRSYRVLNQIALASGVLMAVMLLIVISFQQLYVPQVHYPAAVLLFAGSVVYMWVNAFISLHMKRSGLRKTLSHRLIGFRFAIAALQVLSIALCGIFSLLWYLYESHGKTMFWWSMNAVFEYVMASSLGIFCPVLATSLIPLTCLIPPIYSDEWLRRWGLYVYLYILRAKLGLDFN